MSAAAVKQSASVSLNGLSVLPGKENENIDLVAAIWCMFAPGRSGMYETVKELVWALNHIPGVMAGVVDPNDPAGGKADGYITTQSHTWAHDQATIHCSSYFMSGYALEQRPRVQFIHGTPEACYDGEKESGSFSAVIGGLENLDGSVVFNKRQASFWSQFDQRGTLYCVPKGIDLDRFKPQGKKVAVKGSPAIGMGEILRSIKVPLVPYWAINEYYKTNEKVRLYHWGVDGGPERSIMEMMMYKGRFDKFMGDHRLRGVQEYPEDWMRAVDMVLSPSLYGDPSRVACEAMACGCPVINFDSSSRYGDSHSYMHADALDAISMAECIAKVYDKVRANRDAVRQECRQIAEQHYDINTTAAEVAAVLRKVQAEVR
jgi:glycosyltransferase involved in cell wall biosynthesis